VGKGPNPGDRATPTCSLVRNEAGVITAVGDSVVDVLGWRPDQLIGRPSTDLIHPNDQASAVAAWFAMVHAPGSTRKWRGRYRTSEGRWRWIEAVNTNRLDDPESPGVFTTMRGAATDHSSLEDELRAREELIARLTDALPVGVFQVDRDDRVLFTNGRLHHILSAPPAGDLLGQFAVLVEPDRTQLRAAVQSVLDGGEVDGLELRLNIAVPHPDFSSIRVCQVSLRPLTEGSDAVTGAIGCVIDVTESVELRRELQVRATTDALTGCLNRAATFELLDQVLQTSTRTRSGMGVIFIDLDRFKIINDLLGHGTGDRALLTAVEKIRSSIRDADSLGRIGGDEFLVVCPAIHAPEAAVALGQRISESIRGPLSTKDGQIRLSASVGIAWTVDHSESPDALIARADAAMYQSKLAGDGTVVLAPASAGVQQTDRGVETPSR
jgi:diguanylate cyclase (GGDEF)-like protein/PAS domain S-box-containing protein